MAIGTPVDIGTGFLSSSSTTVPMTVSGGGAAVGDLVIVVVGNDGGANIPASVTDSKGNTYTASLAGLRLADNYTGRVFSSVITTALVNGDTITGTVSGGGGLWDKWIAAVKVTGSWDSTRVDKTAQASGSGTALDSGNTATTTAANELIFGLGVLGGAGPANWHTAGSSMTEIHDVNTGSFVDYATAYRIVSATGAYKYSATSTNTDAWAAFVVTFKEAAGGGGSPQSANPSGLASAGAFGTVTATPGAVSRTMTGLGSAGAFGSPSVQARISVPVTGLGSAAAFGSVATRIAFGVNGVPSAGAFGSISITPGPVSVSMTGLGSAGAFGTASAGSGSSNVNATGLGSAAQFGAPSTLAGNTNVPVTALGSAGAFGSPTAQGGELIIVTSEGRRLRIRKRGRPYY